MEGGFGRLGGTPPSGGASGASVGGATRSSLPSLEDSASHEEYFDDDDELTIDDDNDDDDVNELVAITGEAKFLLIELFLTNIYCIYPVRDISEFAFEHEEQHRRGVRGVRVGTPPPLIVRDEDNEAEASYQEELATALRENEEERHKEEKEEATYHTWMAEAIALSAVGDCVVVPLAPLSPARLELAPAALKPHEYIWRGWCASG
ncbi:hypothetical protein D1007_35938 [Hordeum vulgare]|nr:hypothetical protein D1007_35938 [Hordeum vulgare]